MSFVQCLESDVSRVLDSIDTVCCDCDGVLYLSQTPIPGANEAIRRLEQLGKKVLFVTNNGAVSRMSAMEKLNRLGFEARLHQIFTPSFVVAQYLRSKCFKGRVYIVGEQGLKDELEAADISCFGVGPDPFPDAAAANLIPEVPEDESIKAVIVGYDHFVSLPKLVKVCTYARHVEPEFFLATNSDAQQPTPRKDQVWPETGPFISFVSTAVGRQPVIFGKPNVHLWSAIQSVHPEVDPNRTIMFGDNMETDIAFGNNNNFRFTVLVETGIHKLSDALTLCSDPSKRKYIPSHHISSLSQLSRHLKHELPEYPE